jgi:hypothetical protein
MNGLTIGIDAGMEAFDTGISSYAIGRAEPAVASRPYVSDVTAGLPFRSDSFDLARLPADCKFLLAKSVLRKGEKS